MERTDPKHSIAVIGAGSWGTTIARVIADNNPDSAVRMWAYERDVVKSINDTHQNAAFLPGVALPESITATHSLRDAVADTRVIILATPSKVVVDTAGKMRKHLSEWAHIGYLSKGFCKMGDEIRTISDALAAVLPRHRERIVAISGPSHAEEVSRDYHTCLNVGGVSAESRRLFAELLSCDYLECREIEDVKGVELGGTLKNPAAIAAGMLSVLPQCGDNLAGALMSEALKEMLKLADAFGAKRETILDISGLGDLIATALSEHSRNRRFGRDIGRQILKTGSSISFYDRVVLRFRPEQVLEKMSQRLNYLAEGAYAIEPLIEYAEKHGIGIPVYRSLYEILLNNRDPRLLIETVKNPERFAEIFDETKIHTTRRKKGMERASGTVFRKVIIKKVVDVFAASAELRAAMQEAARSRVEGGGPMAVLPDANRSSVKERQCLSRIEAGSVEGGIEELAGLYLADMTDRFSQTLFWFSNTVVKLRNALINFFRWDLSKGPFRSNLRVSGNIREIRKVGRAANVVYVATFRSYFDFLFMGMAVSRFGLLAPRFLVNSAVVKNRLRKVLLKFAGGYIVNISRLGNPLYREVVKAYLSTLLEHGVPVLFFPELLFFKDGRLREIHEEFVSVVVESLKKNTEEIALIPVEISYFRRPPGSGDTADPGYISWKRALENTVSVNFSKPVMASDYSHRDNALGIIVSVVRNRWQSDAHVYPHYLFCALLREHDYALKVSEAKRLVKEYLWEHERLEGYSPREVMRMGIGFLEENGLGRVEDRVIRATARDEVDYYAGLMME